MPFNTRLDKRLPHKAISTQARYHKIISTKEENRKLARRKRRIRSGKDVRVDNVLDPSYYGSKKAGHSKSVKKRAMYKWATDQENKHLHRRLHSVYGRKKQYDSKPFTREYGTRLRKKAWKDEQIYRQNLVLAERLMKIRPHVNKDEFQKHEAKHEELFHRLCFFPCNDSSELTCRKPRKKNYVPALRQSGKIYSRAKKSRPKIKSAKRKGQIQALAFDNCPRTKILPESQSEPSKSLTCTIEEDHPHPSLAIEQEHEFNAAPSNLGYSPKSHIHSSAEPAQQTNKLCPDSDHSGSNSCSCCYPDKSFSQSGCSCDSYSDSSPSSGSESRRCNCDDCISGDSSDSDDDRYFENEGRQSFFPHFRHSQRRAESLENEMELVDVLNPPPGFDGSLNSESSQSGNESAFSNHEQYHNGEKLNLFENVNKSSALKRARRQRPMSAFTHRDHRDCVDRDVAQAKQSEIWEMRPESARGVRSSIDAETTSQQSIGNLSKKHVPRPPSRRPASAHARQHKINQRDSGRESDNSQDEEFEASDKPYLENSRQSNESAQGHHDNSNPRLAHSDLDSSQPNDEENINPRARHNFVDQSQPFTGHSRYDLVKGFTQSDHSSTLKASAPMSRRERILKLSQQLTTGKATGPLERVSQANKKAGRAAKLSKREYELLSFFSAPNMYPVSYDHHPINPQVYSNAPKRKTRHKKSTTKNLAARKKLPRKKPSKADSELTAKEYVEKYTDISKYNRKARAKHKPKKRPYRSNKTLASQEHMYEIQVSDIYKNAYKQA